MWGGGWGGGGGGGGAVDGPPWPVEGSHKKDAVIVEWAAYISCFLAPPPSMSFPRPATGESKKTRNPRD